MIGKFGHDFYDQSAPDILVTTPGGDTQDQFPSATSSGKATNFRREPQGLWPKPVPR